MFVVGWYDLEFLENDGRVIEWIGGVCVYWVVWMVKG